MAEVELNFDDLSAPELIALGSRVVDGLANNENFPEPQPPVAEISGMLQELREKQDEYRKHRLRLNDLKLFRDAVVERLETALITAANYVQEASGGDAKKIMSANLHFEHGVDLWPFNDPKQVMELHASAGGRPGQIRLMWDPVRGADGYEIEVTRGFVDPHQWEPCGAGTRPGTTLELESGERYWFRVRAVSTKGVGDWSDPVTKYAP